MHKDSVERMKQTNLGRLTALLVAFRLNESLKCNGDEEKARIERMGKDLIEGILSAPKSVYFSC